MTWKNGVHGTSWLPIERILWAPTNSAHHNHLHVVGDPRLSQSQLPTGGAWTRAIIEIVAELDRAFGEGAHWQSTDSIGAGWTHMGVFNPRYIGGTSTWSQHAGANAIDIGPYYGVRGQQKFFDFLTAERRPTVEQFTEHEAKQLRMLVAALDSVDSNGGFAKYSVEAIRRERDAGGYAPKDHGPHGEGGRPASEVRKIIADAINNG